MLFNNKNNLLFIKTIPFFIIGISIGFLTPISGSITYYVVSSIIGCIIVTHHYRITKYLIPIYIVLLGYTSSQIKTSQHIFQLDDYNVYTKASVISIPKNNSFIIECENGLRAKAFIINKAIKNINKGDDIEFLAKFSKIENYKNSKFDYKKYMRTQYIGYQCYISKYKIIKHNSSIINTIHNRIINLINKSGLTENVSEIIIALILGDKSQLDYSTKQNFINAGAIHILAVSGMHTGIIYLLICFMLTTVLRINKNSNPFLIISLSFLWLYALITNLPASICRASLIISFAIIGRKFKRDISLYNAIAASAFIILMFDPNSLFSAGFQLSYAAYISIIYFYPKFNNLISIKNKFLKKGYELLSISVAAQIGTIPISSLYFGQIATYSIITNMLIVFIIPAIMYVAIISIVLYTVNISVTSKILEYLVMLLNWIVSSISSINGSTIHIKTSLLQCVLLYAIMLICYNYLVFKSFKLFAILLILGIIVVNSYNIS